MRKWLCAFCLCIGLESKNPSLTSSRAAIFYLQTAEGEKVSCVLAVRGEKNRISYKAFGSFLDDYRELLPSGGVSEWKFGCMLAQWMDGIIYHSFLRYSEEGVSNAWHLNYIGPADSAQTLPNGLRNYFPGGGVSTWILIRHGFRAWPIEVVNFQFGEGWDTFYETHNLKVGFKITMPCQRKWIFHTAIFDESDQELVYRWAGPNLQWREFHDPPDANQWESCAGLERRLQIYPLQ